MNDSVKSTGAVTLVAGGIAAAFALAACCAVPVMLAGVGIGAAWLAPIVSVSQPHAQALTGISALALFGSVGLVASAAKNCDTKSACARPWFRWSVIAAAILGAALLAVSKVYA